MDDEGLKEIFVEFLLFQVFLYSFNLPSAIWISLKFIITASNIDDRNKSNTPFIQQVNLE